MLNNLLDDLIEKPAAPTPSAPGDGLLDDLIQSTKTTAPPQGQASPSPAAVVTPGPDGGAASGTVLDEGAAFGIYPNAGRRRAVAEPAPAPAPGMKSVLGDVPAPTPLPIGLRPEFVEQVSQELAQMTSEQRVAVMQGGGLRGRVASSLLDQAAALRADAESANDPHRLARREFTKRNPNVGAFASGSAQTLKSTLNIPSVAADFFNQTFVNPVGRALGVGELPRVGSMPGTEYLETAAKDYMPAVAKQSLADAMKREQFAPWFLANMSAQSPQIAQSVAMALNPALRPFMLPTAGAQEAATAYTEGDDSRVAATKGTIAALAEMLPLKAFDKVRERLLALPTGAQRGVLEEATRRILASGAALTVQSLAGGIEEGLTEFGKNVVDRTVGKDTPLIKQVPESLVLGAGGGGVMAVPNVVTALTKGDTDSPAAQLAAAIQQGADGFTINQGATRQAAVSALSPDRAQMQIVKAPVATNDTLLDDLIPQDQAATTASAAVGGFDPAGWTKAENTINKKTGQPNFPEGVDRYTKVDDDGTKHTVITRDGQVSQSRTTSPVIELQNSVLDFDAPITGRVEVNNLTGNLTFIELETGRHFKMSPRAEQQYKDGTPVAQIAELEFSDAGGIRPDGTRTQHTTTARIVEKSAPATPPANTQRVSTLTGRQIDTRLRVIDASELQAASGELQPRDRSRAASDEQINAIAAQLDPQRLGASAEADRGAPIIGPDMIVESGNGRVQGIRRAYAMFPERAQAYRDFLTAQGYDLTGINEPVLVRERLTPLSDQDRVAFVQEANQSATMDLTPVERAKIDVSALTDGVVEVWYGGEITDAANRDFVRGFIGQLPQAQRNGLLDDNGALSPDGAQRIRRALLAAAYEDRDLLVKLVESTDDNIKSIGNALFDSSGQWLQMRRMAREGLIDSSYDVTAELVQAARVVDQLRQSRGKVQEWLAQEDLASPRNPIVDEFVRAFYNANLTRAVGRDAIAEVLKAYVDMARSQDTDGLFGDSPLPDQMVRGAVEQRNERNKEPVTGNLFDVAQPQSDAGAQPGVRQGRGGQADSAVPGGGQKPASQSAGGQLLANEDRRRTPAQDRNGPRADTEEGVSRGADRDTQGDAPADRGVRARGKASAGQDQNQRFKGATGDVFIKASFTNRQSIYRDAFVELGYDPTEAELLPPDRQFMILADGLKKTYGLALVQKADRANLRDSIDQLLDAYRGLQLMAHVLDLPTKAIGLNGELALGLVKNAGYLGAHYSLGTGNGASAGGIATSNQTIVMPGRSNSFAHEWGHALDFYLANKHSGALANLSDHLREGETLADQFPESTGEAFRHLLNAIFFDRAEQSAKIMELERKIEAATQAGKDTAKLKADLANLMSGASKSRNDRSQFYKSAGEFAKATGGDVDYWRKPTEMLARSFEAYISHKVEAAGGTTEFIGKSDAAYQSDAHIRLAKTFPKDADRYNIFRAYDLLFDAIRSDALLNPNGDAVAGMPAGVRLTDPAVYFDDQIRSAQSPAIKRAWEEEKRAWRVRARELEKLAERPSDPRPLMKRMGDAVRAALVTNRGVLLAMERHYAKTGNQSAANAIRQVMERIATDPGSGRKTFAGGTYAEAVERESRRFMTRLSNIRNAADADMMSDADLAQLTAVLTTTEEYTPQIMQAKNPAINRLGAQLRELLTDLYYYNRNAGLDIGFVKDQGYLPRLIDEPVVTANAAEFVRDATEVYKIIFERDTERPMDADDIVLALQALDKRARDAGMDLKRDPELDAYRVARKELSKLLRAMNSIDENDPDSADKIDKAQAALSEFLEQNGDVFEQAYDYIRDVWSGNAAAEYRTRISYGSPENFSSHSPAGSYLKERTLPPEADKILAKYYVQDPIERVTKYLQMSVRKSEYNLRFGRDARGREKNTKLYRMLEQMVNSGVRKEDREMVEAIIGQVTGTLRDQTPGEYQRLLGNAHALGQMALLGRVVLTSLAEPITTAVQTGKPLDALKAVALTIQEIVSTGSVRERRAMARVLGIVAGDYADEMIANRLGGTFAESPNMTKVSANYFRRVGLTGLTNAQRRAAMQLSGSYVLELAHTLDDDQASDSDKGFARAELIDAGIQPEQIEAFVEWSREYSTRMPRHDELMDVDGSLTDMGKIYAVMVGRLVNQAIQSPSAIDRPFRANTPGGRLTYGLLSFTMAFFRNVMMKSIKKVEREYNERGAAQAASVAAFQVLAPIASLYMGHLLVTIMREALLNPDKWEEEEKKEGGFPIKWLAQLAFSRSGFTGLADPLYNALMGVKYQRDLTGLLAGATYGYAAQAVERIVKYFAVNSENTNSAERNAARGLYELTVQPGLAYVTGALPGGPAVGYGLGASYMYMTSPAFKSQWQTWLAGEKESKQKKAGSGQQEDRL